MALIRYLALVRTCNEFEIDMDEKKATLAKSMLELSGVHINISELKRAVENGDGRSAYVEYLIERNDESIVNLNSEGIGRVDIDHLIWKKENLEAELKNISQAKGSISKNLLSQMEKRTKLIEEVTESGKNVVEAKIKLQRQCIRRDILLLSLLEEDVLEINCLDGFEALAILVNSYGWNGLLKIRADGDVKTLLQGKLKDLHVTVRD